MRFLKSRGKRIIILSWLICVVFVMAGYGILRFMSEGRLDSAHIIIKNEITSQKIEKPECIEKCKAQYSSQNIKECECKVGAEIHTYTAKLKFNSAIFRTQSKTIAIEPIKIEWQGSGLKNELSSFKHERADGNYITFSTAKTLEIGTDVGVLYYKTKILGRLFSYCLYFILLVPAVIIAICMAFILITKFIRFNINHPKIIYKAKSSARMQSDKIHASSPYALSLLQKKDRIFLIGSYFLILVLFAFQFWLGFPGYHIIGDTYNSIGLDKGDWHPVFISYILQFLYFVFGKHLFYLFLFNLVPFYAGLLFLVWGFYLRFRSVFAIFLLFPIFVGNIYFQNFIQYHSFAEPMLLFCGYSMLLFALLVPLSRSKACVLWMGIGVVFFFALLWRHNAIFSVYPACFVAIYAWLCNRDLKRGAFLRYYANGLVCAAMLCVGVVIFVPKILVRGEAHPGVPTFLHQIAAMCVPENDSSCFKQEWYLQNKNFEDVKTLYKKYPLFADPLAAPWWDNTVFPAAKLPGLQTQWLKAILKYPGHFLSHEFAFIKAMWIQSPGWIFDSKALQAKAEHPWYKWVLSSFKESEHSVELTPLKKRIYDELFRHKILFNHAWGVALSFVSMLICGFLFIFVREAKDTLRIFALFGFSVGFSGFFSALFFALFTPVAETRYMSPILPLGILGMVGLIAYLLVWRQKLDSKI